MSEKEIPEEEAKKLWKFLFGEQGKVEVNDLSDAEFNNLVGVLKKLKIKLDWEGNKATKTIYILKPKDSGDVFRDLLNWKEYSEFLFLIAMLKGGKVRRIYLGKTY